MVRIMTREKEKTLSSYVRRRLGISLKDYAELERTPVRTLQSRWETERGSVSIQNSVFRRYVERFEEL